MAMLSLQDRVTLLKEVTAAIPTVQSKYLRDMLLLMVALLHDYASLEQYTIDQLNTFTAEIHKLTLEIHKMDKSADNDVSDTVMSMLLQ